LLGNFYFSEYFLYVCYISLKNNSKEVHCSFDMINIKSAFFFPISFAPAAFPIFSNSRVATERAWTALNFQLATPLVVVWRLLLPSVLFIFYSFLRVRRERFASIGSAIFKNLVRSALIAEKVNKHRCKNDFKL